METTYFGIRYSRLPCTGVSTFINGFHDTANAIATSVSTRALTPRHGDCYGSGNELCRCDDVYRRCEDDWGSVTDPTTLDNGIEVVIVTLMTSDHLEPGYMVVWYSVFLITCTYWGLCRCRTRRRGFDKVKWSGFIDIVGGLLLSPLIAFAIGYVVMTILKYILPNAVRIT